jgi:hypothetical protein
VAVAGPDTGVKTDTRDASKGKITNVGTEAAYEAEPLDTIVRCGSRKENDDISAVSVADAASVLVSPAISSFSCLHRTPGPQRSMSVGYTRRARRAEWENREARAPSANLILCASGVKGMSRSEAE